MIKFSEFKKFFISAMVASLIVSALVAIVAVLIGQFNEITARVFLTLFMVILHSLISLAFIWDDSRRNEFNKLTFFVNTVFILIVVSFMLSVFGIWKLVSHENIWHTYQTFFLVGFGALHADMLSKATKREKYIDSIVYGNYIAIILVVCMFLPIIFIENSVKALPPIYFRSLGAIGIVDGTLSLLTIIFYKLYIHKNPEKEAILRGGSAGDGKAPRRGLSIWLWILIIYLLFQIIVPFFFGVIMGIGRMYR